MNEGSYFYYRVTFYNEVDEKIQNEAGFVYGEDYAAAVNELEHHYGSAAIESIQVEGLEPGSVLTMEDISNYEGREI